ncbi:hypothetical protein LWI29_020518 [Acer saccharum]|uniref:SKP1-like protein n=1 Tax=Acer saccharum TaxID=4024 RepID=A0AA39VVH8_ACESA|nr:hypothetical protein LWI29_020518 [Acer saccharum]
MEMETVKSFFIGNDDATNDIVVPLQNVSAKHMSAIIGFYRTHLEFRRRTLLPSTEEVKAFDTAFLKNKSNNQLKELIIAANFLNTKELLDFLIETSANRIKDKSVEYVREIFGIKNDYSPEEKARIRTEYKWAFDED